MTYCLSFFFLLVSLWCYLRGMQRGLTGRRSREGEGEHEVTSTRLPGHEPTDERDRERVFYWCSVTAFALGMLAYPFSFGYFILLAALDWYPLRRLNWWSHWWERREGRFMALEKVPFILLGAIVLVTYFARLSPSGMWAELPSAKGVNVIKQGIQAAYVCLYYVWKPWLPFHLSPVYGTLIYFNPRQWPFWLSVVVVAAVAFVLWRKRNQWRWAVVLGIAHVALLISALGWTERAHVTFDRYGYIPGLAWAVAVAVVLHWLLAGGGQRLVGAWCAVALGVFWGYLSFHQTRIWQNSETLFRYALEREGNRSPYAGTLHGYLGTYYAEHGRIAEAIEQYETSLQVQPSMPGYYRLGALLETNGVIEGALTNYLSLLEIQSEPEVEAKVGKWLAESGRTGEAIYYYRRTIEASPQKVEAMNNLAWILATAPEAGNRHGEEAVDLAERACGLTDFKDARSVETLGAAYAETGRFSEAIEKAKQAHALAQAAGNNEVVRRSQDELARYKRSQPFRQKRAEADSPVKAQVTP
jgi:tetratricopeptide (TPR) repeat protein